MKYYVIINGNSSLDIQGLAIESLPNISKPLIRTTREEIDGRDGDIITKLGYSAYDKTLNIGLWGNYDINEVIAFFNEEGVITFSNEPDKYYKFHILNRIDFVNQLEKFKKASITIHCQPFKYKEQEAKVIEEEEHTTSGTSFNLSDTLEAPLLIDLKGNTSQTGTPAPSSPIPVNVVSGDNDIIVCGKNLFDVNNPFSIGANNRIENNSIILATNAYDPVKYLLKFNVGQTYNIQLKSNNTEEFYLQLKNSDSQGTEGTEITRWYITSNTFSQTFEATSEYTMLIITRRTTSSNTTTISNIQLEQSSTSTTYEPYTSTTYNIDLPVENKLNKDGGFTLQGMNAQGGLVSNNTNALFNGYIDVLPNTSYTLSTNTQVSTLTIAEYNETTFVVRKQANNVSINTITTGSSTNKVRIIISKDGSTTMTQEIIDSLSPQLELGSKPNTFTPYGTTPIELNKIGTYQDYIYKENGKWYLHKETNKQRILSSSWNWSIKDASSGSKFYETSSFPTTKKKVNGNIDTFMCNYLQSVNLGGSLDLTNVIGIFNAGEDYKIRLKDITGNNLNITNLYNWLDNNEVYLYYAIQTPTNTEITYTPLIEQLNTLEEAQSKEGTTNINQVNNDLPFIIDLTYYTGDTSITITNDGNIYSKPLLELKGTGNINIYLNGIQVFVVSLNDEIIYIDTDKMEAYYQGTLKNRQVVGDYNNFKLQSGNNTIQVDGGYVEYLKITNYSRWV